MKKAFLFMLFFAFFLISNSFVFSAQKNVLVFVADSSALAESAVVESFAQIGDTKFNYKEFNIAVGGTRPIAGGKRPIDWVKDGKLKFTDYDIIWLAWNGPGHDGDYFMNDVEEDIIKFVENGGIVYMSAFDDNYKDKNGKQIGSWMPIDKFPCAVMNTADSDVEITPEGAKTTLFSVPNKITNTDLNALVLDDNLDPQSDAYVTLATRTDNKKPAIVQLKYGKGAYISFCIDARSTFPAATKMVENMLNYIATLGKGMSVDRVGKLSTTWASLKR